MSFGNIRVLMVICGLDNQNVHVKPNTKEVTKLASSHDVIIKCAGYMRLVYIVQQ
jgi:hypothetical protein